MPVGDGSDTAGMLVVALAWQWTGSSGSSRIGSLVGARRDPYASAAQLNHPNPALTSFLSASLDHGWADPPLRQLPAPWVMGFPLPVPDHITMSSG